MQNGGANITLKEIKAISMISILDIRNSEFVFVCPWMYFTLCDIQFVMF